MANNKIINSDQLQLALNEFKNKLSYPNIAFILGVLQNINGKQLSAYTSDYGTYGGYAGYKIQKNSTNLTREQAGQYLSALCGSEFTPTYNFDTPLNSYLVRASDGLILKPQYDATNGLVLYEMKKVLTNTSGLPYTTTAPSANNTDGIKIVVLSSEPATKYDGYLYIITGA